MQADRAPSREELNALLLDVEEIEAQIVRRLRSLKLGIRMLVDPPPPSEKPVVVRSPYAKQKKGSCAR